MQRRMSGWRGWVLGAAMAVPALSGCVLRPPPAGSVQLNPPAGVTLPHDVGVMVIAGEADLKRPLVIQLSAIQDQDSAVKDGLALARAARATLARGFARVEINDTAIAPRIVVRLMGKGMWIRQDGTLKLGCGVDAWTTDGIPLGSFSNRLDIPRTDPRADLEPGYARCLTRPVESLLASPVLARLAAAGFPAPPEAAVEAWMRTLGPLPPVR